MNLSSHERKINLSCCVNCFNDEHLKSWIKIKGTIADCSYCNSNNVKCITEINLEESFRELFNLYTNCHDSLEGFYKKKEYTIKAKTLVALIQEDWNIFNEENLKIERIAELIYNISLKNVKLTITSREALSSKWYRNRDRYHGYFTNKDWEIFCNNLKHKYRFNYNYIDENGFNPKDSFNNDMFKYGWDRIKKGTIIYRARDGYLHDKSKNAIMPLPAKKMGIPNNSIITNGRANPPGINYLYTSDDISTVLSEIRAWNSSINSIAKIIVKKDLNIFNLTQRFEINSPFEATFLPLAKEIEIFNILNAFATDLSKPVNPNLSSIDYIPTQYICELIKIKGFDGIKFKSSLGKGNNIILFNANHVKIQEVKLVQVKDISYEFDEYDSKTL